MDVTAHDVVVDYLLDDVSYLLSPVVVVGFWMLFLLKAMGRITGVVDDRGKYIYITAAEMEKVSQFIRHQGRVNMAALAKASNQCVLVTVPETQTHVHTYTHAHKNIHKHTQTHANAHARCVFYTSHHRLVWTCARVRV